MVPATLGSSGGECDSAKTSRRVFDFPLQTLLEYSFLRQDEAARALGVAPITLKRICQRLKYRWPYRMLKAQARREGRTTSKPKQKQNNSTAKSVASSLSISSISSPFLSPEPEPRARTDAVPPSLHIHHPRLKSLPRRRHLELSRELQQQPQGLQRLPSISTLTASLTQTQQLPIRLPNLLPAQQLQPQQQHQLLVDPIHRKLRPESEFPLEVQRQQPEAATIQLHSHMDSYNSNERQSPVSTMCRFPTRSLR